MTYESIRDRIIAYVDEGKKIIPDFRNFVTDKSIPINLRWRVFVLAPYVWKSHVDSSGLPIPELSANFDSPYDDFYMERGQQIDAKNIIDTIEDRFEVLGLPASVVDVAKESLMKSNIGAWTYDW